jgi:hypothetical protein
VARSRFTLVISALCFVYPAVYSSIGTSKSHLSGSAVSAILGFLLTFVGFVRPAAITVAVSDVCIGNA